MHLIRNEALRRDKGILLADHRFRESLGISDRAYVLRCGTETPVGDPPRLSRQLVENPVWLTIPLHLSR